MTEVIAFFNNKGGIGKTSLVFHLAYMYAELGLRVVAADFDPQADLTSALLGVDRLEELWPPGPHAKTIGGVIEPLVRGTGDLAPPHVEEVDERLGLIVGDMALAAFEDELATQWTLSLAGGQNVPSTWTFGAPKSLGILSALWRTTQAAAREFEADVVLVDVAPDLSALNRAALLGASHVIVPLSPDALSYRALHNVGLAIRRWREEWHDRLKRNFGLRDQPGELDFKLPPGEMRPAGYVVMQPAMRFDRPIRLYEPWMRRMPEVYRADVLGEDDATAESPGDDIHCIGRVRHYPSLMTMALELNLPMFQLKPADGAVGSLYHLAQQAYKDFRQLAIEIAARTGLTIPVRT